MSNQGSTTDDRVRLHLWMPGEMKRDVDVYRSRYGLSLTGTVCLLVRQALEAARPAPEHGNRT